MDDYKHACVRAGAIANQIRHGLATSARHAGSAGLDSGTEGK